MFAHELDEALQEFKQRVVYRVSFNGKVDEKQKFGSEDAAIQYAKKKWEDGDGGEAAVYGYEPGTGNVWQAWIMHPTGHVTHKVIKKAA